MVAVDLVQVVLHAAVDEGPDPGVQAEAQGPSEVVRIEHPAFQAGLLQELDRLPVVLPLIDVLVHVLGALLRGAPRELIARGAGMLEMEEDGRDPQETGEQVRPPAALALPCPGKEENGRQNQGRHPEEADRKEHQARRHHSPAGQHNPLLVQGMRPPAPGLPQPLSQPEEQEDQQQDESRHQDRGGQGQEVRHAEGVPMAPLIEDLGVVVDLDVRVVGLARPVEEIELPAHGVDDDGRKAEGEVRPVAPHIRAGGSTGELQQDQENQPEGEYDQGHGMEIGPQDHGCSADQVSAPAHPVPAAPQVPQQQEEEDHRHLMGPKLDQPLIGEEHQRPRGQPGEVSRHVDAAGPVPDRPAGQQGQQGGQHSHSAHPPQGMGQVHAHLEEPLVVEGVGIFGAGEEEGLLRGELLPFPQDLAQLQMPEDVIGPDRLQTGEQQVDQADGRAGGEAPDLPPDHDNLSRAMVSMARRPSRARIFFPSSKERGL